MCDGPDEMMAAQPRARWRTLAWGLGAVMLIALTAAWAAREIIGGPDEALWWGIPAGSWMLVAAGITYLLAVVVAPRGMPTKRSVELIVLVAVAMRVPLWSAPPAPGADCQRYLWDGGLVAHGVSPYRYTPQGVAFGAAADDTVVHLAWDSGGLPGRIDQPHLRSAHPPVAQGLFAVAHWVSPFSLTGWRVVLAGCEVAAALALLSILRRARLPAIHLAVLLWNPILVGETYLGAHLDVAAGAMTLVAMALLCGRRFIMAGTMLVLAAGVTPWPILLLPLVVAPLWGQWRRLAVAAAVPAVLLALLAALYAPAAGPDSGLAATTPPWRANAGLFALLQGAAETAPTWLRHRADPHVLARCAAWAVLAGVAVWQGRKAGVDARQLGRRAGAIAVAMLLLSPTLYPWQYAAVLPLAAMAPSPALLAWTLLLPLCDWHGSGTSEPVRLTILHAPIGALLLGAALWRRRNAGGHTHA